MRASTARAPGAQGLGRAGTDGRRRACATRGGAREGARGRGDAVMTSAGGKEPVYLLDYGAGNVRSVRNAVAALGFEVRDV